MTQEHLAQKTGKKQETISSWEDPNYGSYTLNSLKSLAAAFDVALMVKFAPFSELIDWSTSLTPDKLAPSSYEEEDSAWMNEFLAMRSIALGKSGEVNRPHGNDGQKVDVNETFPATAQIAKKDGWTTDSTIDLNAREDTGRDSVREVAYAA